jgi:DNA primase
MGTAMTEYQVKLVAPRYAKKIVMALDADEAGQNATRRSLEVARQTLAKDFAGKLSVDIRVLQIPSGKDPDDYLRESPEGWQGLVDGAQPVAEFVMDMEISHLPANASIQERQSLANRVLPILMASENNLYKQDNIQKLAMRLRMNERDLLAWANEQWQLTVSDAPEPAPQQSMPPSDYPPDMPPEYWDDGDYDMPPEYWDTGDGAVSTKPATQTVVTRTVVQQVRAAEAYCLGLLMKHPNLLTQVNRKLRELAGNNQALLKGPLCDLGVEDFSQSQYRMLMMYFQEAMSQDDQDPLDYIRATLGDVLLPDFEALLQDQSEVMAERIGHRFNGDFRDIVKQMNKYGGMQVDIQQELVKKALQLRQERLKQERTELQYLQQEAESTGEGDATYFGQLSEKLMLSIHAKARLDKSG